MNYVNGAQNICLYRECSLASLALNLGHQALFMQKRRASKTLLCITLFKHINDIDLVRPLHTNFVSKPYNTKNNTS